MNLILIFYNKMCQHLEIQLGSINQCFTNDNCRILKNNYLIKPHSKFLLSEGGEPGTLVVQFILTLKA